MGILKEEYEYLKAVYSELCNEMVALQEECKRTELEATYMRAFIRWKKSEDEYNHFAQNAHEVRDDDMPFSYFAL